MLEKMFTTKMSADKKKLQNRFSKIRSKNGKLSKILAGILFCIIIVAIICVGVMIAVNNAEKSENNLDFNRLYEFRETKLQDKSAIEEIVRLNNYLPYSFHSVEIVENQYDNRVAVKFLVGDRAMHRKIDNTSLKKMSAIILALVPDAEAVSSIIFDKYSEDINNWETSFYSNYISRKELSSMLDFEKFTEEYIKNAALSAEKFEEYCLKLSSIISSHEIDDYIKEMYDFIGKNYEVVLNSGIGAEFLVDKEFLDSSECKEIYDLFGVDLKTYEGFALQLNKHSIRNFKTDEYKKYIALHYREGDKTIIIKQKIIGEEKAEKVKLIIGKLMKKVDGMVIPNAENLTYTQIKALQYQVDNGHFPWRLDYDQVIKAFLSGENIDVADEKIISFAGDGEKCSATYSVEGNTYIVELFKPIDKSEHGIWVVRNYEPPVEPAKIKEISFYNINPDTNTLGAEIVRQEDGWYKFPDRIGSFINFDGATPKSVTAYFTPAGTNMEKYEKQIGFAAPPFVQIPLSIALAFEKEDTIGHLHFVFKYEDGTEVKTEYFNVLIDN